MQIDCSELSLAALEQQLPGLFTAELWEDAELMAVKKELNITKSKMDSMDIRCTGLLIDPHIRVQECVSNTATSTDKQSRG